MTLGSLWTFGYGTVKDYTALHELLDPLGVDRIVDIRLNPSSGLSMWSWPRDGLTRAGFRYDWLRGLGNLRYRGDGVQIADPTDIRYVLAELRGGQDVALMCACGKVESCHRRVVAELIRAQEPGLRIIHRTGGRADSTWVEYATLDEALTLF